ncbi:MFS transporter [Thalassobacter stenotrophicus]|uniref:MFS transporter n=1 Tax=Thalassobacter stenotrophicus TaxID=266809 RepID=UPI0022A9E880|nr:MFS transporter [Thalassobacter stenotrophicus]UYP67735.1 MFS transporter [Thalassobacter stenotrophicus]
MIGFFLSNIRWLAAGALLAFSSSYGQTFFIAIFAGEIRRDFGLSHGDWGLIYGIGTGVSALIMVWAGGLTDRFRVRTLSAITLILLALSCIAMAVNPFAGTLVFLILALRVTGQGMLSHIPAVAMTRWFVASRGRALAIAALGFAVAQAFLPMLFVMIKDVVGWRVSWAIAASFAFLAIPLLVWLLQKERTPQSHAEEKGATGMGARHWTRAEAIRHPLFWAFCPSIFGLSAWGTALFFHQVHLAEVKGWTHADLTLLFPVFTVASVVAMLSAGAAIDRFGTRLLVPTYLIPAALGFMLLASATSLWVGGAAFVIIGATQGMSAAVPGAFWAEHYGTQFVGSIKALATAVMVAGSAAGPWITGAFIDTGLSFNAQFPLFSVYFVGAGLLAWLGLRSARPA